MASKNGASLLRELVTLSDLASLCVCSERTIQRLTKQGVLPQAKDPKTRRLLRGRYELGDAMPRFVEHLRDTVTSADPSESAYQQARARRMAASAEMTQLELAHKRGDLIPRERVIFVVGNLLTVTKNHLLALASRITRQLLPHVSAETGNANFQAIYETVNGEVRAALTEASEFDMKQLATAAHGERDEALLKQKVQRNGKSKQRR